MHTVSQVPTPLLCISTMLTAMDAEAPNFMTRVDQELRTDERAPVSGIYEFVRFTEPGDCQPPGEREIRIARGERFPPERHCGLAAVWRLVREA